MALDTHIFYETNFLPSAWMFLNIPSNLALNVSKVLKTSNKDSSPDLATSMQETACLGFVRHTMGVASNLLLV